MSAAKGVIDGVVTHPDGTKERFTALRTIAVKKINGTGSWTVAASAPWRPATS